MHDEITYLYPGEQDRAHAPKRKVCTFCGRLRPRASVMPDPQHGTAICRDRSKCVRDVLSAPLIWG